ncbi:MAG TPA: argininosuccinate lyase, partial [Candidatus Jacksonbacteria bacterium]|nr:argininosuccinate lyase [Candidatus Jacksonbacteria bacterium]
KKPYDERLIPYDIAVNQAHVKMLSKQQIISAQDARLLLKGLEEIKALYKQGKFTLSEGVEDVHTAIE